MKKLVTALAVAASALLVGTAAQAAIVLSFTPSDQNIAVGGTATVDVAISGLGSEILSGFDLNLIWNSAVLGTASVDFAPACTAIGDPDALCLVDDSTPGLVSLISTSFVDDAVLAAAQPDAFTLGTLTFTGLADGVTTLTLGADPVFTRNFVGLRSTSLSVDVGSACIAVGTGSCNNNTVPEPASYALVMLALTGALLPAARRRRAAKAG